MDYKWIQCRRICLVPNNDMSSLDHNSNPFRHGEEMEIYRKNISQFLNFSFIILCLSIDPIYYMILAYFPLSLILALLFGAWMGLMDLTTDWEIE